MNKKDFSYELNDKEITIEYKNYAAVFDVDFIKQQIPQAVTDDQIDYSKLMGILANFNWEMHDLYMVARPNGQRGMLLMRESYKAHVAVLEHNINMYLNPLFNKDGSYNERFHKTLLEVAKEITDNQEFVLQNGKKYKIKLVEV